MTRRPTSPVPTALLATALLAAPLAALADASPAGASSPVTDNTPPKGIHPVAGVLLTGTLGGNDKTVVNPDGSSATGNLGARYGAYAGAEFPLTAGGLRLRLTAGVHVGTLSGGERFTRFPLEAAIFYPVSDELRVGAGVRYPMRMRFGGAGGDTTDGLSATPGVLALVDYRLAPHLWLDMRYVVERYNLSTGGSLDASHWGIGASAMY
jgi:hypothetical protein